MKKQLMTGAIAAGAMAIGCLGQMGSAEAADLSGSPLLNGLGLNAQSLACTDGSVTGFTDCVGSFALGAGENDVTNGDSGNLASQILATGVFGNITNWTFNEKINDNGTTTGSDPLSFNWVDVGSEQTSGSFNFSNLNFATTALAISLKSARGFSMYYLPAGSLSSSTVSWNTLGVSTNPQGNPQALSHASVYFNTPPTTAVPTPALLPALAGMGLAAVRKRKQVQEAKSEV
jgi:hypothetical protein